MLLGVFAGLLTCALWGLSFVGPRAVVPFSAFDLAACRYGLYAIICILLMAIPRFRPRGLSREHWMAGLLIGAFGSVGYFISISFAVKHAGAVIPPLILGTMPVLVPIIANFRENTLPWKKLAVPLGMIVLGIAVANADTLVNTHGMARSSIITGSLWAVLGLLIWIGYSVGQCGISAAFRRARQSSLECRTGIWWRHCMSLDFAEPLVSHLCDGPFASSSRISRSGLVPWQC